MVGGFIYHIGLVYLKKILRNLLLLALLTLCFTLPAHAAEEVTINAASYSDGSVTRVLTGNTAVSMGKGKNTGYKINFDNSPSKITLKLGTSGVNAGTIEIRLDSTGGQLLGTIKTNASASWTSTEYSIYVTDDISGEHKIFALFKSGTHDFHYIKFYVPDPEESYHSFSEEDRFNDIRDNSIRSEINLMADLGILGTDKPSFDGNQLVTKREFMKALTAFYRYKVTSVEDEILFSDVVKGSEDFELVRWLCGTGVLKADPYKALNPGGALTMEDAAQMLCNLLDYTEVVEAKGSALTVARSLGLLSGVSVGQSGKMKRQEMAHMLWNALESKYNRLVGVTHDNYLIYDADTNVLKQTGGIYMAEGVVTANQSNNLYSNINTAPVGAVLIDDEIYYCDKTAAAGYLGFNCVYFYEEQDSKRILKAIRPAGDTEYMYLRSDEYDLGDITEDVVVYYDVSDKEKELDIESRSVIMYNGRPADDTLTKLIGTEDFCGSVLVIDNDGNGKYDVVMVEHAETIIFGGVTKTSVYDSLTGKNIMFDDTESIRLIYGTMNGTWNEVAFGTLLDMYRSKNKTGDVLVRMYPVTSTKIGVVSEMDGEGAVTFEDGSVYEAYSTTKRPMVIGKSVTLKLNSYGRYVDYILGTPTQVGLVLDKGLTGSGLSQCVAIRMLTEDNEIKIFDFAKSVYADGVICEEINGGKDKFVGLSGMENDSVVLYALNGDGEVSMLDTPAAGAGGVYDALTQTVPEAKYQVRGTYLSSVANGDTRDQNAILAKNYKLINYSTTGNEEEHGFGSSLGSGDAQRTLRGYSSVHF